MVWTQYYLQEVIWTKPFELTNGLLMNQGRASQLRATNVPHRLANDPDSLMHVANDVTLDLAES